MGLFLIITPNTHGKVSEAIAKEKSAHGDVLCVVHERAPIAAASDHLYVKKTFLWLAIIIIKSSIISLIDQRLFRSPCSPRLFRQTIAILNNMVESIGKIGKYGKW